MRFLRALALLAALPACDRVFGLTDTTTIINGDDTNTDGAMCTGTSCVTVIATGQMGAHEIVSDPGGKFLAWNPGAQTPAGEIWGCEAARCSPVALADGPFDQPHSLLYDTTVMWASDSVIARAKPAGGPPGFTYSPGPTPLAEGVASFAFTTNNCWIVSGQTLYVGDYANHTCTNVHVAPNLFVTTVESPGNVTSQVALVGDPSAAVPVADTEQGAYVYDANGDITAIYTSLTKLTRLATTPKWIAGIIVDQNKVFAAAVGQAGGDPVDLDDKAIAIKADFTGNIYVATRGGDILRIVTPQGFGPADIVASGIPNLQDFTFDADGNIFAISGDTIIRIPAL